MADHEDPFVKDLIADAKLIASYGQRAGSFKDTSLFVAITAVERLDDKSLWRPELVDLQKTLNNSAGIVPFSILAALKSGWTPFKFSKKTAFLTFVLVAFSIGLMIVTAQLTYLYNKGLSIVAELESVNAQDPERRYGQLVRQLLAAREQIDNAAAVSTTAGQSNLTEEAYYQLDDDMHELDAKLLQVSSSVVNFSDEARFPIWGMRPLYCATVFWTANLLKSTEFNLNLNSALRTCGIADMARQPTPGASGQNTYVSDYYCDEKDQDIVTNSVYSIKYLDEGNFKKISQEYTSGIFKLYCSRTISYFPHSVPPIKSYISATKETLSPYALWILPGLYGALGATMFHMRMILNPLMPNPPLARLVHRIALGSLAGMVLGWFFAPDTRFGGEVMSVGFSTFSLAFLFGFSLDIFFTILDRFVSASVASINKLGQPQGTPAAPLAQSNPSVYPWSLR